jgi:sulfite reductase alpha subunit-like flavoprotein
MNNKLEGFVKDNKKEFEANGPSAQLWNRIAAELDNKQQKKKTKMYQWMSIAAMLVISLSAYFSYQYQANTNIDVADVSRSFGQKEIHLASLIEEKKDSLQVYAKDNPELYHKFIADVSKLNADYEKLKKELQTSPNSQIVVKAMMKNLDIQLQVLNQQLMIINQANQYKKESTI